MLKKLIYKNDDLERARYIANQGDRRQCLEELDIARNRLKHAERLSSGPVNLIERAGVFLAAGSVSGKTLAAFGTVVGIDNDMSISQLFIFFVMASWLTRLLRINQEKLDEKKRTFFLCLWGIGLFVYGLEVPAPWKNLNLWFYYTLSLGCLTIGVAPFIEVVFANSKFGLLCSETIEQSKLAIETLMQALHKRKNEFNAIDFAKDEKNKLNSSVRKSRSKSESSSKRL